MKWYKGKDLLEYLETIEIIKEEKEDFCLPIQRVCRPNANFRGYQGQIEKGEIAIKDEIIVLPSKEKAKIKSIYIANKKKEMATKGMPVTIEIDREIDISRGCVIAKKNTFFFNHMFSAQLLWTENNPMEENKTYYIKIGTKITTCVIKNINYKVDINTGEKITCDRIERNDIANCDILLQEKMIFEPFQKNKTMGSFILINPIHNTTAACGMICAELNDQYINYQEIEVTKEMRSNIKRQKPLTIWFTGLSGAGKSTLANGLEKYLISMGKHTMLLDGDNIRLGLNRDLTFSKQDRHENIRRTAEVAKLMNDAGLIVITAFISPYESDREMVREIIGEGFVEVYVNTAIEVCERRDVKGLYEKARKGIIKNFTGITSTYEPPKRPEILIDNNKKLEEAMGDLVKKVKVFVEESKEWKNLN